MRFPLLSDICDLSKCTLVCIGYDQYLLLEGEEYSQMHEIHVSCECPDGMDAYIYEDDMSIIPLFFSVFDIGNEEDFDSWDDAEIF